MTDRLQTCLEAGSTAALFPLLSGWRKDELEALMGDVEEMYEAVSKELDRVHRKAAFHPANFFSRQRSEAVDKDMQRARLDLLAMCSEIMSVAMLYLEGK